MRRFLTFFFSMFCAAAIASAQQSAPVDLHPSIHIKIAVHAQTSSAYPGVPTGTTYVVNLAWSAPAGTACTAADPTFQQCGFNVYRLAPGGTTYALIGTVAVATTPGTSFTDSTPVAGTDDYVVETIATPVGGTTQVSSGASNMAAVVVPNPLGAPASVKATTGGSN